LAVRNSYLIHVMLKSSNFFGRDFYNILHIFANFIGTKSGD